MSEALKEFVPSSEYSSDFKASNFPIMIAFDRNYLHVFPSISLYPIRTRKRKLEPVLHFVGSHWIN